MVPQDAYYQDQSEKSMADRRMTNYDHPDSLDNELLISQLKQLLNRETIEQPTYDYTNHTGQAKQSRLNQLM